MAPRFAVAGCLILCDLDHFKRVNDDHGHERGDVVLRELSYEMRKSLRSFELFYRLGGESSSSCCPASTCPTGSRSLRACVPWWRPVARPAC
jgi:diguanylate cyclase (GGDEF)-like protein